MTKINIISGFLGAGKTTLIRRLITDVFPGEKLVLIENELGELDVDGGFLQDSGIIIKEMLSGCICCSLVGDFAQALQETVAQYAPDRILIEPSGVAKLSDVRAAVARMGGIVTPDACITVADCTRCRLYHDSFGAFYRDQLAHADCVLLSRTDKATPGEIAQATALIRHLNQSAGIITTPLARLDSSQIRQAFAKHSLAQALLEETLHAHHHQHQHCGCHGHDHHHADEVFAAWSFETAGRYTAPQLQHILSALDEGGCGTVLRAKGMVDGGDGWLHFDYVPGEYTVRPGSPCYTGRICVIGTALREETLAALWDKTL